MTLYLLQTTRNQIANFEFQYRNAGLVKCVFCTCDSLHCSKSPTHRTSLQSKFYSETRRSHFKTWLWSHRRARDMQIHTVGQKSTVKQEDPMWKFFKANSHFNGNNWSNLHFIWCGHMRFCCDDAAKVVLGWHNNFCKLFRPERFLLMRSFYESVFLFTTQCSSPNKAIAFNALFLWEHSHCVPEGAKRQWAAHGENSGNDRTHTRWDPFIVYTLLDFLLLFTCVGCK